VSLDKLVGEYLWKEVLDPGPRDVVGLLLATSVVERLDYGLAEALTRRPDAGDLLVEAEASGLFVTSPDLESFEVHSLVRHVLVERLRLRRPDTLRTQHARAAEWFETVGDGRRALDHWLRSGRHHDALRVLSELALPLLESGDATRLREALDRIPVDAAARGPDDAVRYAWCQLAAGTGAPADALGLADAAAAGHGSAQARTAALHAVADWWCGDWRHAASLVSEVAGARPPGHPVDRAGWHVVTGGTALDERWDDRAQPVSRARVACLPSRAAREGFEAARVLGLALAGDVAAARQALEDPARTAGGRPSGSVADRLALAEAVVQRELDHREQARAALEGLAGRSTHPDPALQVVARLELVRLHLSLGDLGRARAGLEEAEREAARLAGPLPGLPKVPGAGTSTVELVARAGVELALATDDVATALRRTADVVDPFWRPACEAKISFARGRHEEAQQALRRAVPRCPRHQVVSGLLLGQALAPRDRGAAVERVGRTLETAARHGMLRTVASDGTPVAELIELGAWRVPEDWMAGLRRALVPTWVAQDAHRPVEDLTDREREVLRLLPSRLTLSEIAAELYVSPNTLKFHLRAIYRKLGVVSRGDAVDSARHMLLLPR
jgi:LuxR family maltose regulon positive regulatory protein